MSPWNMFATVVRANDGEVPSRWGVLQGKHNTCLCRRSSFAAPYTPTRLQITMDPKKHVHGQPLKNVSPFMES